MPNSSSIVCADERKLDLRNTTSIGNQAESSTADYLTKLGYEIIDRNFKSKTCEIDIVARKNKTIYFVEVKYRSRSDFGDGIEYINTSKLNRMKHACEYWCHKNGWNGDILLAAASVGLPNYEIKRFEIVD